MSNVAAKEVTPDNLLHEVALLKQQGFRLITLTCLDTGEGHDVIFHFDKHYQMSHLRLRLGVGQALVSITSLYPAAMVVENEIKDHFGLRVEGLSLDFQGRLVLTEDAPRAPMGKRCGMDIDARVPKANTSAATANPRGAA